MNALESNFLLCSVSVSAVNSIVTGGVLAKEIIAVFPGEMTTTEVKTSPLGSPPYDLACDSALIFAATHSI